MNISEKDKYFKEEVFKQLFPVDILEEFYEYWSEPNKLETKMRWELEKTWDIGRRLKRWQRIRDSRPEFTKKEIARTVKPLVMPPTNEMERLQAFFTVYTMKPYMMDFEKFEQWFDFMKDGNILIELSNEEKELLKSVYGKNAKKLRCAWVQKTMDFYFTNNKDFKIKTNFLKAV